MNISMDLHTAIENIDGEHNECGVYVIIDDKPVKVVGAMTGYLLAADAVAGAVVDDTHIEQVVYLTLEGDDAED